MSKLQLFIAACYLQISLNDVNFKFSSGIVLINEVSKWFYQLDQVTISKNAIYSVNFAQPFH